MQIPKSILKSTEECYERCKSIYAIIQIDLDKLGAICLTSAYLCDLAHCMFFMLILLVYFMQKPPGNVVAHGVSFSAKNSGTGLYHLLLNPRQCQDRHHGFRILMAHPRTQNTYSALSEPIDKSILTNQNTIFKNLVLSNLAEFANVKGE